MTLKNDALYFANKAIMFVVVGKSARKGFAREGNETDTNIHFIAFE